MFYKKLPKAIKEKFEGFYDNRKHSIKAHTDYFNENVNKYFYRAQEILVNNKNKHFNFVQKNKKYKYEDYFMYLEQEGNLIILYKYYLNKLSGLIFYDISDESQYAYVQAQFKMTGINMMLDPSNITGMGYYNKWNVFYDHKQLLTDKESIRILKSVPKLKYIPIEKLIQVNYYHLLNASSELLNHWEILLKIGAYRVSSDLHINRESLDINYFRLFKDQLKNNVSVSGLNNLIKLEIENNKDIEIKTLNKNIEQIISERTNIWKYSNYIFKLPEDIEEIKEESEVLKHCLYSSRNLYFKEDKLIVLMRKKNDVDTPFYTIEINSNGLEQVRTTNNQTNQEVREIATEWYRKYFDEINDYIVEQRN